MVHIKKNNNSRRKKKTEACIHTNTEKRTKIIKNTVMTQQIQQHYHKPASVLQKFTFTYYYVILDRFYKFAWK